MIEIHGITDAQVQKLNKLWSIETTEELHSFLVGLDENERREYNTLSQLVIMAQIDGVVDGMRVMPEVDKILKQISP